MRRAALVPDKKRPTGRRIPRRSKRASKRNMSRVIRARVAARRKIAREPMVGKMPHPTMESSGVPKPLAENWETITGFRGSLDLLPGGPDSPPAMEPKSNDRMHTERDSKEPSAGDLLRKGPEYDMDKPEHWREQRHQNRNVKQTSAQPVRVQPPAAETSPQITAQGVQGTQPAQTVTAQVEPAPQPSDKMQRVQKAQKVADIRIKVGKLTEEERWDYAFKIAEEKDMAGLDEMLALHQEMDEVTKTAAAHQPAERPFVPPTRISTGSLLPRNEMADPGPAMTKDEAIFGA